MALMAEEEEDYCHINDLPDDVLLHILSFLTIKEMRQTSALSRRWRPLWRLVHNLSISINESLTNDFRYVRVDRIARLANQILFHDGLNVVKVRKFGLRLSYCRKDRLQIYEWIDFATSRGVEELNLTLIRMNSSTINPKIPLPPSVFACESLRALSLRHCVVNPSHGGVNLASLKTMSLSRVIITDDGLQTLSSNAPLLENLSLTRCNELKHLKLSNLKKLNRLALYKAYHLDKVEIDGRNLRCLEFEGRIGFCEFISFGAVGTPSMSTGSLMLRGFYCNDEEDEESHLITQSLYCPLLETLNLYYSRQRLISLLTISCLPLKNLVLYGFEYARGVNIEAPSLRFFKYRSDGEAGPLFHLINSHSLHQANFRGLYNIKYHIRKFAHVRDLRITTATTVLKGLIRSSGIRPIRNLRHLDLIFNDNFLESDVILLLQSCPQLESLSSGKIPQYEFYQEAQARCMCPEGDEENHSSDCWKFRLKKVKVTTFEGCDFQMNTIKFLLNEAENLESMEISLSGLGEEILQDSFITKELLCYMRSSARAEDCNFSLDEGNKMLTFNWTLPSLPKTLTI